MAVPLLARENVRGQNRTSLTEAAASSPGCSSIHCSACIMLAKWSAEGSESCTGGAKPGNRSPSEGPVSALPKTRLHACAGSPSSAACITPWHHPAFAFGLNACGSVLNEVMALLRLVPLVSFRPTENSRHGWTAYSSGVSLLWPCFG